MITARAAGDAGLLLDTDAEPAWLAVAIARARLPGVIDVVPGARTVLVVVEPGCGSLTDLAGQIAELPVAEQAIGPQDAVEIPVVYDGPDLAGVATLAGAAVGEVIRWHSESTYTVGWLGFAPGFGYLTGLDERLAAVPRLTTPRSSVPAGSVAIAAGLAAVYPSTSPGGWRLLGRTSMTMWDPEREPAALLAPGRQVLFRPVDSLPAPPAPAPGVAEVRPALLAGPRLEVVRPGPLATVQDLGRPGLGAVGVPPSGAADQASLITANRLAGNVDAAAGIELTLGRAAFTAHGELTLAVAGAPAEITVTTGPQGRPLQVPFGEPFVVPDGAVVGIGAPSAGLRTYVAARGGVTSPAQLGSRSADLLAGLGGGPLRAGTVLPVGDGDPSGVCALPRGSTGVAGTGVVARGEVARLRVIGGPRLDWFAQGALRQLCASVYAVAAASNRTGMRLEGPPVHPIDAELASEGLVTGSLQVPRDGQPILLLADHQTVGGYPVIAVVVSADVGLAAQLRPGSKISFVAVDADSRGLGLRSDQAPMPR